jgi:sialate O-acetylesterase
MEDCRGKWMVCTPNAAKDFSAIGFFFARRIHQELDVPVGVIEAAQGGTGAEQWISREGLEGEPALQPIRDQLTAICERAKDWDPAARHEELQHDNQWAAADLDDDSWLDIELPQTWQNAGYAISGQIYLRKRITIPPHWVGKELTLSLGPIKRFNQTVVNGVTVGDVEGAGFSSGFSTYTVPATAVPSEQLLITIRTDNGEGFGGFMGRVEDLRLALANAPAEKPLSLAGRWRFTTKDGNYWITTSLFNGMIRPLIPFAIKGVLWYQGESNAGWFFTPNRPEQWPLSPFYGINRGRQYRVLFPALIRDWRKQWGQDFPFLYAQLPNQTGAKHVPSDPGETNEWSEVREAQTMALALPHTGMAVTFDLNHEGALHPTNKAQFSERLENLALAKVYGKSVACDSPLYESFTVEGAQIRIKFRHAAGGLVGKDGATSVGAPSLRFFTLASADRQWKWATATIEGATLVVSSSDVPQPVAVRYGWPQTGPGPLFAKNGLPVSPFRTDDWLDKP